MSTTSFVSAPGAARTVAGIISLIRRKPARPVLDPAVCRYRHYEPNFYKLEM